MSGVPTLALMLAPRVDAGVEEFVRLCVGFVAGGGALAILEVGAGRGVLADTASLPGEVERSLEGLAEFGVRPWAPAPSELQDLLRVSQRVLRVADPGRRGDPELLVLDEAYLETVAADVLVEALARAGQVIRP